LLAELEFGRLPELCKIATIQDEVRLRIQGIDVLDSPLDLAHELLVQGFFIQVRVGDVREAEQRSPVRLYRFPAEF
jgi:hypothetical protein